MYRRSINLGRVHTWRKVFTGKAFTIFAVLGIIAVAVSLTQEIVRKVEINRQIRDLETEIADLEQHNTELNEMMAYFNSSAFQEKEARTRLGLKESGETMVVLPNTETATTTPSTNLIEETTESIPNSVKWKRYFFN